MNTNNNIIPNELPEIKHDYSEVLSNEKNKFFI